jgi:integrase
MSSITKRGKSWVLSWYEGGKQRRQSLGPVAKFQAEKARYSKELELSETKTDSAPYFDYYAAEYLDWYAEQYPASLERCRQIIINHLAPFFGDRVLSDIGGRLVKDYQLTRSGAATGTYLKEFRTLKAMLNRAVEWEVIKENPISHIKPPKDSVSKPPHFYSVAELERLYEAAYQFPCQWKFMANTGIRLGEAINFRKSRDVKENTIQIISIEGARTKSGKWREVPLFDGAREALSGFGESPFDCHSKSVSRAFRNDAARADLGGSLHSLRHTFISHLFMSGKFSAVEIQHWAGHSSLTTTQRSAHHMQRKVDTGALKL